MKTPFTSSTPIGTLTNYGILTHFDEYGFAYFIKDGRKSWVGSATFHFVQIREK